MFSHNIKINAIAADPGSCDSATFVLAHFGEDGRLVEMAYRRENNGECGIPVFTYSFKPRLDLCSVPSLTAALPRVEMMVKEITDGRQQREEAVAWVDIFERCNAAHGRLLMKFAGL